MKAIRIDGSEARLVLTGMIVDPVVCGRITAIWPPVSKMGAASGLFDSNWCNLVAGWCVKYFRKYNQAPEHHIARLFEEWTEKTHANEDKEQRPDIACVERLLKFLSNEWRGQTVNSDYVLDVAGKLFNRVRARKLIDEVGTKIEANDVDGAYRDIHTVNRVNLGVGALLRPEKDYEAWDRAISPARRKPLFRYPGALGRFFGDVMARDSLIAFMGPDKAGKSFVLLDAAYRAVRERRKVAYFEAGDLLQDELLMRLGSRAALTPLRRAAYPWPKKMVKLDGGGEGKDFDVVWRDRRPEKGLTPAQAFQAWCKVCRKRDVLRISCHPNSTLSVTTIASYLRDWALDGWTADVVVIDYADILDAPVGYKEPKDQIDELWKQLRRLSQESHVLVLTATQVSAAAYTETQKTLGKRHFSGRKTKLAHCNAMIGINHSTVDREQGIIRLNWVVRRSAAFNESRVVATAGSLALAHPFVVSAM